MSLVIVGKLGSPYGIEGWQHVLSYTDPIDNILQYPQWHLQCKEGWKLLTLYEGRSHGKGIVVKLSNVDTPESAALLTNNMIGIDRHVLKDLAENEFYWTDLEGLAVLSVKGESLGNIVHLYENAQVDIMVIKDHQKERHIPFLFHDTVLEVDMRAKKVIVDWDLTL